MDPSSRPMDYGYGYSGMNGGSGAGGIAPEYQEENLGQFHRQDSGYGTQPQSVVTGYNSNNRNHLQQQQQQQQQSSSMHPAAAYATHKEDEHHQLYPSSSAASIRQDIRTAGRAASSSNNPAALNSGEWMEMNVSLLRHETGFGFRIVGGTEEGSQVSIGHIVPGGAADVDGRLRTGDEILSVDGMSVVHTSHHHVVQLMGAAALNGRVTIGVRRWMPAHPPSISPQEGVGYSMGGTEVGGVYPYDVTVMRREDEGFGFVIISSVTKGVSFIGQIIRESPAERCSRLQVGDRILAVNHHDISRLHHGDIVNLIKDSGYTVTLTVGPPLDDASGNATNSHRSCDVAMVTAQALPAPTASDGNRSPNRDSYHLLQQFAYGQDQPDGPVIDGTEATLDDDQLYAVELSRGTRGFGFSIRGGREFHQMPLFVLRIADNGSAAQDGRLRVGDQLIEINGISTKNMTHADAIELIKNGGPVVRLLLRRSTIPPSMAGELNGQMLSPTSTGSPTTPSGGVMQDLRPGSSMAQPMQSGGLGSQYVTSNGPSSLPANGLHSVGPSGPPPYLLGSGRVVPSGRGHLPAPLNVPPMHRNLNGPLSHSSPRVIGTNVVGGDYYWGS